MDLKEIKNIQKKTKELKFEAINSEEELKEAIKKYCIEKLDDSDEIKKLVFGTFTDKDTRCFLLLDIANKYNKSERVKKDLLAITARIFVKYIENAIADGDHRWASSASITLGEILEDLGLKFSQHYTTILECEIWDNSKALEIEFEKFQEEFYKQIPDID